MRKVTVHTSAEFLIWRSQSYAILLKGLWTNYSSLEFSELDEVVRMFNNDLSSLRDLLKHIAKMAIVSIDKTVETTSPAVGIGVDVIPISRCNSLMKLIVVRF